jgi:hypothetical protein
MVQVANAAGVWHSFGYNFDDPNGNIQELSAPAQSHLGEMPPFITDWQAQDIANNDYGGYYQNNMQSISMLIYQAANSIYISTNNVTNMANIHSSAATLRVNTQNFLTHTAKLSGVIEFDGSDTVNPHLQMALSFGRTAMYITSQTDGITNNAPILGSFSSLMIEPQLVANNDILVTYANQVANTITYTTSNVIDNDPQSATYGQVIGTVTTGTSNMAGPQMAIIDTHIKNLNDFMDYRRNSDVNFYTNVKRFIDGYNKTKKLNNLGETEKYLLMNFIGTNKCKERIS